MNFRRLAFFLLASTSATACLDDELHAPPPRPLPGNDAHLGKLTPAVQSRAFAAASGQDITVALYTADLLQSVGGACVKATETASKRTLAATDCITDAGVTLDGSVTFEGPKDAPTSVVFESLVISGGPDSIIDGSIATQRVDNGDFNRQVDLAMERGGVSVHTVLDYQERGVRRTLVNPSHIDLPTGGPAAIAWGTGGEVRLTGGDQLTFTPDASVGACGSVGYGIEPDEGMEIGPRAENGDAPTGLTRVCLWTPFAQASVTSARGSLRSIDVCPASGAPRVVVESTGDQPVTLDVFDVGPDGERAPRGSVRSSAFARVAALFRLDSAEFGFACDASIRAWQVIQDERGHHQLLTSPPVDYVLAQHRTLPRP